MGTFRKDNIPIAFSPGRLLVLWNRQTKFQQKQNFLTPYWNCRGVLAARREHTGRSLTVPTLQTPVVVKVATREGAM
jgi:hypothetical protein